MLIFIYVPGFYAAVEQADDMRSRGEPVAVGGDPEKGGTVTSASREARTAGVEEGMDLARARALCADLRVVPTRVARYREVSAELRAILRNVTGQMEPMGLDGAYLEAPSGSDPLNFAAELCVRLQAELALAAVAGIGPTRFLAHSAALHVGPGGVRQVRASEADAFLRELPVTELWGLGPATGEKLAERGIHTIGQLAACPLDELRAWVGRNAGHFKELAEGRDRTPLRPAPPVKSLSRETTLPVPSDDLRSLGESLLDLSVRIEDMLLRERRSARTVTLGLRYSDGEEVSRTLTGERISKQSDLHEIALRLLARTQAGARAVRKLRLRVTNLERAEPGTQPRQLRLF